MMKKVLLCAAFSVISVPAFADCENFFPFGKPTVAQTETTEICRPTYFIKYYNKCKDPLYVVEYLDSRGINGKEPRLQFTVDPILPESLQASPEDYVKSGYDKGHMAPAADFHGDHVGMRNSFYLSNAVPQARAVNRGVWRQIETHVRTLAVKQNGIYVITGATYPANPKMLGRGVCIPDNTFKIVIDAKIQQGISYVTPNVDESNTLPITLHQGNIAGVEKLTGINFAPNLPATSNMKTAIGSQLTGTK